MRAPDKKALKTAAKTQKKLAKDKLNIFRREIPLPRGHLVLRRLHPLSDSPRWYAEFYI